MCHIIELYQAVQSPRLTEIEDHSYIRVSAKYEASSQEQLELSPNMINKDEDEYKLKLNTHVMLW
jgi:hypothetical protein